MLIHADDPRPQTPEELLGPNLLAKLERLDVTSRKVFPGRLPGERRSKRRGRSVEFDDYREYVAGDDLRFVDWNVYARFDKFVIKLFREEEDLAVHVVIDATASMHAGSRRDDDGNIVPSKLVYAHRLAMALGAIALVKQNRLIVSVFGLPGDGRLRTLAAIRGRPSMPRLADFLLATVNADTSGASGDLADNRTADLTDFNEAMKQAALTRSGKGVCIVISDMLTESPIEQGLSYLAAGSGFDTTLIQLLAPAELDPMADRDRGLVGDLRLTDAETGRGKEVTITGDLIRRYRSKLDQHLARVEHACRARSIGHALVRTDADLAALLFDSLRKRGPLA
ncbi:MAG: DUF58 domain-containing protein [Planctomycetota bacterium]